MSTKAYDHLAAKHPDHVLNRASKDRGVKRVKVLQQRVVDLSTFGFKQILEPARTKAAQAALVALSECYVYARHSLPKSFFGDPVFIRILQAVYDAGRLGKPSDVSKRLRLTDDNLARYVSAHYEQFKATVVTLLQWCLTYAHSNPFAQLIHDGVTLANGHKYLAVGISFIDPESLQNHQDQLDWAESPGIQQTNPCLKCDPPSSEKRPERNQPWCANGRGCNAPLSQKPRLWWAFVHLSCRTTGRRKLDVFGF